MYHAIQSQSQWGKSSVFKEILPVRKFWFDKKIILKIIIVWFHDYYYFFRYEFCILCNCTFHEEKPCRITRGCKMKNILTVNSNPTSPSSSTTSSSSSGNYSKARVSSKVSKRRLKRLWQLFQNFILLFSTPSFIFAVQIIFFYKIDYNYRIL